MADWILPHLVDRPLTLVRCPNGIRPGPKGDADCFFMKHSKVWTWPQIRRVRIREKTKVGEYMIAGSLTAIVALVQMGVIEIHTWNSRFADVERPDRIVIDLDPVRGSPGRAVIEAARLVRQLLSVLDLELRQKPPAAAACTSSSRSPLTPTGPRACVRARVRAGPRPPAAVDVH